MANKTKHKFIRWSLGAYRLLNIGLVLVVAFLIGIGLTPIAILLVVLSKWRVLAVQPHHWLVNIRSNSPDLIVGLSFVVFMTQSEVFLATLLWVILYISWLLFLKPKTDPAYVGVQAMTSQFMGLTALFWVADSLPDIVIILGAWFIASVSAQHYLNGYDEPLTKVMSVIWALFVVQLAWLMNRWLIVYPMTDNLIIPQISIVTGVLGYIAATIYHLSQAGKLSKKLARRYVVLGTIALAVIIVFSNWTNEL